MQPSDFIRSHYFKPLRRECGTQLGFDTRLSLLTLTLYDSNAEDLLVLLPNASSTNHRYCQISSQIIPSHLPEAIL